MAAAHACFSFSSFAPLLHSALPVARSGGQSGRNSGFFRPSPVIYPGREPVSHELSDDFDFQESLLNVQALLHQHLKSNKGMLSTVDHLKRLCIDHYFQDEIDNIMESSVDLLHSDDLLDATLSLRLMREVGYYISADDVLQKFTNDNGDFNLRHSKDLRGLLSLHDMSHLNMGEASLYKAKEFSSKHLKFSLKYLEPNLARYVMKSLDHPYHVSLKQYKARHHLSYLQNLPTMHTAIEKLALVEFQMKKLQHQSEMQEVKRWWVDLGLSQEIPAARDQVLKWYMWSMTILEGFSFSRWDLAAAESLPSYMISCYKALYTITNDIADMVIKEHGLNPINHLKQAWATLFDGFMIEGKWLSTNQVPTSEDYLRNGVITSGAPLLFLHLLFMLGHDLTEDNNDHILRVISCPAKIMRLWDDMGSAKDELQEGLDGSYKDLYQRENPHADAEKHMLDMIAGEWEDLNRECFSQTKSTLPPSFIGTSLNFARMVSIMYGYDDEQRLPALEDYTRMLLF
ncbi:S-(+)-linalool synthase, chloroplastic-like isoform X2 [Triticum dicoccoides]|uniref:S-(+)-linalool synthase, chloroplastic-like isoform X2 n=1 Tax=Triticum dicoccoides TaxID=85692 RepID=UPI0018916855|nr:S-(+)-linalool synthase, chloroplastic-like isoform X2 [Triticum dicoccoides]XP_044408941.1 S-(+)-linalool synthase, chloroplastic-like isoform X2 [Triticum aestivum]